MSRNRVGARGSDDFREAAEICLNLFGFLATDFGYRVIHHRVHTRGFSVAFGGDKVGVQVAYYIRDGLTTLVVLLDDGKLPTPIGEMTPDSYVAEFDLRDIEVVSGVEPRRLPGDALTFRADLEDQAARLRAVATPLLRNDLALVPSLQQRVLERARRYAIEKWGDRASEWGW